MLISNKNIKVALVLGVSKGIGLSIVKRLSLEKKIFVVGTLTTKNGIKKFSSYLKKNKIKGYGIILDIRNKKKVDSLFDYVHKNIGLVDILINNIGYIKDKFFLNMNFKDWNDVLEINLISIFHICKKSLKDMFKLNWGRIIHIGSVVSSIGNEGQTNYSAAKCGIIGFNKSLAKEVALKGITCNVISPGLVNSGMTIRIKKKEKNKLIKKIPMNKICNPDEISKLVIFLINSSYITGQTIHINGGMYMN